MHRRIRGLHRRVGQRRGGVGHTVEHRHRVIHARGDADDEVFGADSVGKRRQQRLGVSHDRAVIRVVTVHEPGGELELGVQSSTGAQQAVGSAAAGGHVRVQNVDRSCRCRGKPLQVDGRIADGDGMPIDDADDRGNAARIIEEEAG